MSVVLNSKLATVEINLDGNIVLIDRGDFVLFASHPWRAEKGHGQSFYLKCQIDGSTKQFHRMIMGEIPVGMEIDHINQNGLDNRKSNLRIVTHQKNQSNQPKRTNAASKYFGVCRGTRKAWQVGVNFNHKRKNLGHFDSEIEAAHAYDNFLIKNNIDKPRNFS